MANRAKKTVIVQTAQEWNALDSDVSIAFVKSYSCNDASLTVLNVSRLTSLQELSIGDYCFENVKEKEEQLKNRENLIPFLNNLRKIELSGEIKLKMINGCGETKLLCTYRCKSKM